MSESTHTPYVTVNVTNTEVVVAAVSDAAMVREN